MKNGKSREGIWSEVSPEQVRKRQEEYPKAVKDRPHRSDAGVADSSRDPFFENVTPL